MSRYLLQLRSAVAATVVDWPTSFWWFGRHAARLPAPVARALPPETARDYLVQSLERQLYSEFYCQGLASPQRPLSPVVVASADEVDFVRRLSAANRGHGRWDEGWTVRAWDGDHTAVVTKDGLQVWARVAELRGADLGARAAPGAQVGVRQPKELFGISPGFYMATGDQGGRRSDGGRIVRLYWHLSPAGAVAFVSEATAGLNRAATPFGLKVAQDLLSFERCDPVVVYLDDRDYPAAAELLAGIHRELSEHLRPAVPALTRQLVPGVGLAEDPGDGVSFGYHRCRLVAEGLVAAHEVGERTVDGRLDVVADHLGRHGVSVDAPFRNAGSTSDYPIWPAPAAGRGTRRPPPAEPPAAFLAVASSIGTRLVDAALWDGDRCTWIDTEFIRERSVGGLRVAGFGPVGGDVYAGAAGIAVFLADLAAATGDTRFAATATAAARTALSVARSSAGTGLYEGWPGTALAAVRVARTLDVAELTAGARDLVREGLPGLAGEGETDLLLGAAGAVVALLGLAEGLADDTLVDEAARAGDRLVASGARSDRGCSWPSPGGSASVALTGLSHGAAGIAYALVELFAATGGAAYAATAREAFEYEHGWFDPDRGNWRDLRDAPPPRSRAPGAERFATFWCHGAPGIAVSRLRAGQVLDGDRWWREAEVALATTRRALEDDLDRGAANFSLCHGLAGSADVLLYGAEVLGRRGPSPDALVRRVAEHGLEAYARPGRPWPCGVGSGESPTLLLGLAGIGHFFLRVADPSVATVLAGPGRAVTASAEAPTAADAASRPVAGSDPVRPR